MNNKFIENRLKGIQEMLMGAYQANKDMSSATKGIEREVFINLFLSQVFPRSFRFGKGDAIDQQGNRSGQLDIVIEFPFLPSLPIIGDGSSRLYIAEGIAAVIEIKSNIQDQWYQIKKTADNLGKIQRDTTQILHSQGNLITKRIPFYVVGYKGWKRIETIEKNMRNDIDGILIIEPGLFYGEIKNENNNQKTLKVKEIGPKSLWGLLYCIHNSMSTLFVASKDAFGLKS